MSKISTNLAKLHHKILQKLHVRPGEGRIKAFLREFICFGYKEAICCVFPAFIFGMLAITKFVQFPGIYRYDLLLIACVLMQWLMLKTKLETRHEFYVICVFHLLGISMEIFKVAHGSWAYPEPGYTKIMGVPLYSGFMYASVASYVCQAWRHFDLTYKAWPQLSQNACYASLIYGNFYTNAYVKDIRLIIIPLLLIGFSKTIVYFNTNGQTRQMPMSVSFLLIAFFIWLAENIGTFLGAWRYPHQTKEWTMVKLQLMSSWFLLVIVSVIIVAMLKMWKKDHLPKEANANITL